MGHVSITHDDGTRVERDLASVIIMNVDGNQPRELIAMQRCYEMIAPLSEAEARRVVTWVCEKFPLVKIEVQ